MYHLTRDPSEGEMVLLIVTLVQQADCPGHMFHVSGHISLPLPHLHHLPTTFSFWNLFLLSYLCDFVWTSFPSWHISIYHQTCFELHLLCEALSKTFCWSDSISPRANTWSWTYSHLETSALHCTPLPPMSSVRKTSLSCSCYLPSIHDDSKVCTQQAFLMLFLSHVLWLRKTFCLGCCFSIINKR